MILDQLRNIVWQNSGKGARPKPMSPLANAKRTSYGKTDRSPEEVKALLASVGPQRNGDH